MKKYQVIYADPPWEFSNKNTGGSMSSGALAKYPTMTIDELCKLPVPDIADDNCVLFMWWVAAQPKEAIRLAEAWGFTIKTMSGFNWVKLTKLGKLDFGMGFWTRAGSELCMVAVKGKPKRADAGIRSVVLDGETETVFDLNEKHSKKPHSVRLRIEELMGDVPRIELFARQYHISRDVFGNEVKSDIFFNEYVSL